MKLAPHAICIAENLQSKSGTRLTRISWDIYKKVLLSKLQTRYASYTNQTWRRGQCTSSDHSLQFWYASDAYWLQAKRLQAICKSHCALTPLRVCAFFLFLCGFRVEQPPTRSTKCLIIVHTALLPQTFKFLSYPLSSYSTFIAISEPNEGTLMVLKCQKGTTYDSCQVHLHLHLHFHQLHLQYLSGALSAFSPTYTYTYKIWADISGQVVLPFAVKHAELVKRGSKWESK